MVINLIYLSYKRKTSRLLEIYFIGTFYCKADAKGRVMLPVALRNQVTPILNDGFFIKKSYYDECLELYPAYEWNAIMAGLNAKLGDSRKDREFKRKFTAGLRRVEIDATGRLLIPKDIIGLVNIKKEVVLAPMDRHLELWDREAYEGALDSTPEEREELAYEVKFAERPSNELS